MTRANKTRSALFTSIISLLLCVSMLVGTTFAWFTDTAASGLNQIIAGNLDVALLDKAGNNVESKEDLFTMPELWEPGAVAYAQIQVANVGTLDLKASLSINYEDVNSLNGHKLSEVLKYAVIDASNIDLTDRASVLTAAKASTDKGALSIYDFDIELEAGGKSPLQTLVVYWEPGTDAVDNLYNANNGQATSDGNPLQINLGVKVFATQLGGDGHEEDSFGPDYDMNAPAIITVGEDSTLYATLNEALEAAKEGDTIKVNGPARYDFGADNSHLRIDGKNVTIEGVGSAHVIFQGGGADNILYDVTLKNLSVVDETFYAYENGEQAWEFTYLELANITAENVVFTDGIMIDGISATTTALDVSYDNTFTNCTFMGHNNDSSELSNVAMYGAWVNSGSVLFDGCKFIGTRGLKVHEQYDSEVSTVAINNCIFKDLTEKPGIVIGTLNEATTIAVTNSQFINVQPGDQGMYTYESDTDVGIFTFTIDGKPVIASQAAFKKAIDAAQDGDTIYLMAGTYDMVSVTNKTVNISGSKDAVLNLLEGVQCPNATINFKNITIVGDDEDGDWYTTQLAHATKATYENCTINGLITVYAPSDFTNCVFNNTFNDEYSVYCYSSGEHNFTDCTFNTACSKAIKVYDEVATHVNKTVNVTNCKFVAEKADKAAVEIDSRNITDNSKYVVNITNCEITENYDRLYNDKGTNSVVTVDGNTMNPSTPTVKDITTPEELMAALEAGTDSGSGNWVVNIEANIDLTGKTWTPYVVKGYTGAGVITINGNGHTITGLSAPLFSGGFAGQSGIVINDLTIQNSNIVSTNTIGSGAFIESIDSMPLITLKNCKLQNSTVTGSRTGGLIGWNAGYNNPNNGPVRTNVTVEDCSVIDCEIIGAGTVGGIVGHAGNNPNTVNTITNCTVKNTKLTSNDDSYRVGAIVGTANVGEVVITGCTSEGNTILQNNNGTEIARPAGQSELYGRTVFGSTGKLTIDGVEIN